MAFVLFSSRRFDGCLAIIPYAKRKLILIENRRMNKQTIQVDIQNVSKKFGQTVAVDDVSLQVYAGEIFGLLGPNGAGKTTTIRMMLDIMRPDSGSVAVLGGPMTEAKKERIGYLPEERGLYADQKLWSVILYLASLKGMSRKDAADAAEPYLHQLDLWEHRDKKLSEMSRGMHQKAQFIVTVLHRARLDYCGRAILGAGPSQHRPRTQHDSGATRSGQSHHHVHPPDAPGRGHVRSDCAHQPGTRGIGRGSARGSSALCGQHH